MPSIVGWNWHQVQQRTFTPMPQMVRQRAANVNYFYTTTDIPVAARILDHYNVEYIIVGVLERARYPRAGLDKFETMTARGALEVVYEVDDVRVYRVNSDQVTQLALEAVQRDEIVRVEE